MKALISTFLLCMFVSYSYAQLSMDSLRKMAGYHYEMSKGNAAVANEVLSNKQYGNASECMENFFSGIVVFDITPGPPAKQGTITVCDDCGQLLFMVDANTGALVKAKEFSDFNKLMDRCIVKPNTLDKAYLYLILNRMENGNLASPESYWIPQVKKSTFLKSSIYKSWHYWEIPKFISTSNGIRYNTEPNHYIDISSSGEFYIPAQHYSTGKRTIIIHQFNFDNRGRLVAYKFFPQE